MIIYPAIDLRDGKCVRLLKGDYSQETIYEIDPIKMAKYFCDDGANWLHIVDLDAAKDTNKTQLPLICKLANSTNANIQVGGGIRSSEQIKNLLNQGVSRVIIGTAATENLQEVRSWFNFFGADKLVLALDFIYNDQKKPMVAINAWQRISYYSVSELIGYYASCGLRHVLCTNIERDGTLNEPDYVFYKKLKLKFPFLQIQASGGVQSVSDLTILKEIDLSGVVIGKAFYEKKITMKEALSC